MGQLGQHFSTHQAGGGGESGIKNNSKNIIIYILTKIYILYQYYISTIIILYISIIIILYIPIIIYNNPSLLSVQKLGCPLSQLSRFCCTFAD